MVGNDIVDLADAEALSLHPRFDARVFSREELYRIAHSESAQRMRWILWAAKESAYKVARRRRPTVFSPVRFRVELESERRGNVVHDGSRGPLRIETLGSCIHAVVSESEDFDQAIWGVARLSGADASESARQLAIDAVAARLGIPREDLCVESVGRIPRLVIGGERCLALSISHHGSFVGFACRLDFTTREGSIH